MKMQQRMMGVDRLKSRLARDIVMVHTHDPDEIPQWLIRELIELARKNNCPTIVEITGADVMEFFPTVCIRPTMRLKVSDIGVEIVR